MPAGGKARESGILQGQNQNGRSTNSSSHSAGTGNGPSHSGAIGHPGSEHGQSTGPKPTLPRLKMNSADGSSAEGIGFDGQNTELAAVGPHSIIQRAVQEALQQICRPSSGNQQAINLIEQVGVFPVDSPNVPGYLVLAWPHEEKRAIEPFFKQAQQIITQTFRKMGVQATLEPGFFVQLPQVEFAPWALEAAAFSFATNHGNEEIGVAFFPTDKPIPKPKPSEDKNMLTIDVKEISTEEPVTFKVYLHMKKNKKYFLYLRNGRQLLAEQKTRLEGNQVRDVYMKSIDVENMRQFLASCHLKQKLKKAS